MIQDIYPKQLNNQFIHCRPKPEDRVICIQGRDTWLLPDNSDPSYRQFQGLEGAESRYLFSIAQERFVLIAGFTEIRETAEETVARRTPPLSPAKWCGGLPGGEIG